MMKSAAKTANRAIVTAGWLGIALSFYTLDLVANRDMVTIMRINETCKFENKQEPQFVDGVETPQDAMAQLANY